MNEEFILQKAREILQRRTRPQEVFGTPSAVKDYFCIRFGPLQYEVFAVAFLDSQNGLIACEEMFRGTLTQTSVYPREVVRRALQLNAGAVVFSHNHPSGVAEPSRSDEYLTTTLKSALALIDVRVLDHIVCGGATAVSMAERGML